LKSKSVVERIAGYSACWLLLTSALTAPLAVAQSDSAPAETLRNILTAACSQDVKQFGANLTVRNAEAFARLTKAAQTTLLRRFVLLDQAGQARLETDAQGNVTVFCVTPELTTQMQFGKVELRDNLAYLPLVDKDTTNAQDANTRRITMGPVKENGH